MKIVVRFGDETHEIPLNSEEDFTSATEQFPQLRDAYRAPGTIRDAAQHMTAYLNKGHMNAQLVED